MDLLSVASLVTGVLGGGTGITAIVVQRRTAKETLEQSQDSLGITELKATVEAQRGLIAEYREEATRDEARLVACEARCSTALAEAESMKVRVIAAEAAMGRALNEVRDIRDTLDRRDRELEDCRRRLVAQGGTP